MRRMVCILIASCVSGVLAYSVGAQDSKEAKDARDLAKFDARIKPGDRQHWSYLPVKKPNVPAVKNAAWVRNPIDAFVLERLEKKGWKPAQPAEPRAWLRRIYLDITGLPPTVAEQDAFLKNPTPDAMD